jgi:protein TonB
LPQVDAPLPRDAMLLPASPAPPFAISAPAPPPVPASPYRALPMRREAAKPRRTAITGSSRAPSPRQSAAPATEAASAPQASPAGASADQPASIDPPGSAARAAQSAPIAADWRRSVFGWLAAHKAYPDEARRRGEEGRVVVRFTVDRLGNVVEVVMVSRSGSTRLDDATQAMLRDASLPPFPAQMSQDVVTVTVQISYRLTD